MRFSEEELNQLLKAWVALSFAFAIAMGGGVLGSGFINAFVLSGLTVGLAFLLHELSHKFVAQKFGCWAEFRSFDLGLILAVLMAFSGFIFAAPGAVMIAGLVTTEENGKIAVAGPITNLLLAGLFVLAGSFIPVVGLSSLFSYGFRINSWLAFFNLLPFWQLDGFKVFSWSRGVWFGLIVLAGVLVFVF